MSRASVAVRRRAGVVLARSLLALAACGSAQGQSLSYGYGGTYTEFGRD